MPKPLVAITIVAASFLVDKNRRIRAFCDGTDPVSVDKFLVDIEYLLMEMEAENG